MRQITRREIEATGTGLTNCGLDLGTGIFELVSVTVRVTPHYAVVGNVRLRHTISGENVWDSIVRGYASSPHPLMMTVPRKVEGPCRIHAEMTFPESLTMTLVVTYGRVDR